MCEELYKIGCAKANMIISFADPLRMLLETTSVS
jgi:hypothetical protein